MRLAPIIVVVCSVFAAYKLLAGRPVHWSPGVLAPADPVQQEIDHAEPVPYKGIELMPRARFSAEVRVLSRERYRLGALAAAVPLDFAVGWGPMSDSAVLADIKVSQGNRFYFWHYDDLPIPRADIETHSANWHLVPATTAVFDTLDDVRVGEIVQLEGELVDIKGTDFTMHTSLTRKDTGAGACEVLYVESIKRRDR